MAYLKFINLLLTITLLIAIFGCSDSSSSDKNTINYKMPVINEQSVVRNGCMNIQAVQNLFHANAIYPGLEITTDFKPDSKLSNTKALFHTNAAFGVRNVMTSDIFILMNPVQEDCSSITAKTVSGEALKFSITSSSPSSLSFSLQNRTDANLPNYRKEGLEKKLQPIRYDVQILSGTHLRISTTYKSFDAHCRSNKLIHSIIQKDYVWSEQQEQLPVEIALSENFYNTYLSTVTIEEPSLPQAELKPGYIHISVDELRNLSLKAVKEELKRCIN